MVPLSKEWYIPIFICDSSLFIHKSLLISKKCLQLTVSYADYTQNFFNMDIHHILLTL